jgi:hypothetical protein
MNSEEEQLKRRADERKAALIEKVDELKQRAENIKQMTDVRFIAKERPAMLLAGSVLIGFIAKKFAGSRNRRYANNGAYRTGSGRNYSTTTTARIGGRLWEPVVAAMTAVATRTAIGLINDLFHRRRSPGPSRPNTRKKF